MRERVLGVLQSRSGVWVLAAIAAALALPSLGIGLLSDDHLHAYNARFGSHPLSLFYTTPEDIARGRSIGLFAWWSSPNLRVNFFRPLASLLHVIEFRGWPEQVWAMHLTSIVLYALLVVVAVLLYRALLLPGDSRLAALASLLFAIDDGHAPSVGWISGRNTLLAAFFGMLSLLLHVKSRRAGALLHAGSALCVGLSLLSAEAGIAVMAYLLAYAIVLETGSWQRRLLSIAPELAVFASWAIYYAAFGFGVHGTSFYRDVDRPFSLLLEGVADLPLWLYSLLGPSLVSVAIAMPAALARALAGVICVPLLAALALGLPRTRLNLFFGLGALLCLPPLFTTQPQERLLIMASFGAFGLLASFIATAAHSGKRFVRGTRQVLIALHFVLAPLMFTVTLAQSKPFENGTRAILASLPSKLPPQLIFVNTPIELLGLYTWNALRDRAGVPPPESLQQLYSGSSTLVARRIDATTLELRPSEGWGRAPIERVFGAARDLPPAGSELAFASLRVSVRESTADGRPLRVQFHFPTPLESPERSWFVWEGTAPKPWTPPPIGSEVTFAPLTMVSSLGR